MDKRTTKEELISIHEEIELLRNEVRGLLMEVKYLVAMVREDKGSQEHLHLSDMEIR